MAIRAVWFDLDGTLLPMEQEEFVKAYFGALAAKLAPYGYEPNKLVEAIWTGTGAMVRNDGSCPNEKRFWESFATVFGERVYGDQPLLDDFYEKEFDVAQKACGYTPKAAEVVGLVKSKGLRVALATNPIFPAVATKKRVAWAGLDFSDFELVTTYENSSYCKPNPAYYQSLLDNLGLAADEVLMVGNDVGEDMIASTLGIRVFLLTDCLICREGCSTEGYAQGDFDALLDYLRALESVE